jgi:PEP-CTERM motif
MRCLRLPLVVLFFLSFAVASQIRANSIPIRGGSTYGDNTGFSACVANITDFVNTSVANNCEGFSATTFTIGGNTYNGALFAFLEPGGTGFGILDIIELSGNSSLTLNLVNPSAPTGVFMCGSFGSDSTVVQDSTPSPMTGLACTPGSSPITGYTGTQDFANITANFSATGVTFVNGNSTGIAVFTEDGNLQGTTTAPEPASLMLLAVGLLAVGRKFHRIAR